MPLIYESDDAPTPALTWGIVIYWLGCFLLLMWLLPT